MGWKDESSISKLKTHFKRFLLYSFPSQPIVADIDKRQSAWQFRELPYFIVTQDQLPEVR